ncbi:flagellar basal body protein [Sphingomonas sp. T9W2]|uniref:flagellar basal body rod protein FlgB n=1 Tax=Sphingomonas sp. T9W2 TaxID=3143183 RepID=UPI0031F587AA
MDALTSVVISKALDGLTARAEATAANIANANSPGYRPMRVDFEEALRSAAGRSVDAVAAVRPTTSWGVTPAFGTEARLDLELATASETSLRFAALIDVLGREMGLMRAAIAGGR